MALVLLRVVFVMVAIALAFQMSASDYLEGTSDWLPLIAFFGVLFGAGGVLAIDLLTRRKRLDVITSIYFGAVIGLFLSYVFQLALTPLLGQLDPWPAEWLRTALSAVMCYAAIAVLLQTRDDFRFIIPYVEFAKEIKGLKPLVLDTSVVIDGRIAEVVETQIIENPLIMPQFVIGELQSIADSSDKLRRGRGRRGLDILNRLQSNPQVDLRIFDQQLPELAGQPVDQQLVLVAKHLEGKVVTNDYNLNKVAKLHKVGVVNLNDLANALKPNFLPGESFSVRVVKPGEDVRQGVGYLQDGTMVVIDGGREAIDQEVVVTVTSMLQTSAGRMVFARLESIVNPQHTS